MSQRCSARLRDAGLVSDHHMGELEMIPTDILRERLWTFAMALRGAADQNRFRDPHDRALQGFVAVADIVATDLDALADALEDGQVACSARVCANRESRC